LTISETLLQVQDYQGEGYRPIIDFGAWRMAILRYHPELEPHAINAMQRHDETDEVFVLLSGRCILFIGEGDAEVENVHGVDMEPLKAYNVKQCAWHTHTLTRDATVLIVENQDTRDANSPTVSLTAEQRLEISQQTKRLWS
jgi:hypothetical protein